MPKSRIFNMETCLLKLFAKIKFSRINPSLQYLVWHNKLGIVFCTHLKGVPGYNLKILCYFL